MKIVYAVTSSVVSTLDGNQINVRAGTHWPDTDPVVLAQPSLFSPDARYGLQFSVPPTEEPVIERATAAPGERRPDPRSIRRG